MLETERYPYMNSWFKFYGAEFLTDPKMLSLTAVERSLWITLLCLATNTNGIIKHINERKIMMLTNITPLDDEWKENEGFLQKFKDLEMITIDNAMITITNFQKRQESNLTGYERVKRYREKKKEESVIKSKPKVINDNTDDNTRDNDREDKKREDKNIKKENKKEKSFISQEYLENIPLEDFEDIEITERQLRLEAEKALNWLKTNGVRKKDYKAFMRNWVLKNYKKKPETIPTQAQNYEVDENGLARLKEMKKNFHMKGIGG